MSKFCPNCGTALTDDAIFCGECGTKLSSPETAEASVNIDSAPSFPQSQPLFTNNDYPGADFPDTTGFSTQSDIPVNTPQSPYMYPENPGYDTLKKPKKKSKLKVIIPVISLLLVAVITLGIILPSDGSSKSNTSGSGSVSDEQVIDPDNQLVAPDDPSVNIDPNQLSRTIMIYIVGSDLESKYGAATSDIQEMINAEYDTSKVNVLLCAGGANAWNNNIISAAETSYYLVTADDLVKVSALSSKNMGTSNTLSEFLNYGYSNYPAERYSLILWDHGAGPMYGYGQDELSYDILELDELSSALMSSPFNSSNKLEVLGFDACLMNTIETAWTFKDYAEYFVASQELEPGDGWDYVFLEKLNMCRNGAEMGKVIVDSYFDFYTAAFALEPQYETEITLSCLNLSKVTTVESALNQLFSGINQDVLAGQISTASRCRYSTKTFGKYGSGNSYDLVDLKHITTLLSANYPLAANLDAALNEFIVYAKANVANANGVSIYHPYDDMSSASSMVSTFKSFNFASNYADYISNFAQNVSSLGSSYTSSYKNFSKTAGTATQNGKAHDLSIQLTKEQTKTFSGAQYYVFWEMPKTTTFSKKTEYLQVFSGQDVNLSSDGKLTATYAGKAVYGKNTKTGKYSDCPLSMNQIYDGTQEEKYYFPCMFWYFGDNFEMEITPVNWLMKIKNGVPTLSGAYDMNTETQDMFPDKHLIDINDYNIYNFSNNSYFVSKDANGNTEFTFSGSSYGFEYTPDEGFSLELRDVPDKSQYRAVFVIEDIYGNRYFSDFIPLG